MRRSAQFETMTAYNWQLGWYVRDRWQTTRKLTLSFGVRYELFPLQTRAGRGGIAAAVVLKDMILQRTPYQSAVSATCRQISA
jgi:hypothetical protein